MRKKKNTYFLPLIPSQRIYYVARESVNGKRVLPNPCDDSVGLKLNRRLGISIQSKICQNERLVILQLRPRKTLRHKAWVKTLAPVPFNPKVSGWLSPSVVLLAVHQPCVNTLGHRENMYKSVLLNSWLERAGGGPGSSPLWYLTKCSLKLLRSNSCYGLSAYNSLSVLGCRYNLPLLTFWWKRKRLYQKGPPKSQFLKIKEQIRTKSEQSFEKIRRKKGLCSDGKGLCWFWLTSQEFVYANSPCLVSQRISWPSFLEEFWLVRRTKKPKLNVKIVPKTDLSKNSFLLLKEWKKKKDYF